MRVFQPQCTIPDEGPAFIQQPNVRSTMDIVWSSVFIIFLCTWSILHLNVPPQIRPLPPAKNFWEKCRRSYFEAWYQFRRKAVWMLVTILAPEYILGTALTTRWCAVRMTQLISNFLDDKHEDEVHWTVAHSYYANMGGCVIKFDQDAADDVLIQSHNDIAVWMKAFITNCEVGYPRLGAFDWNVHAGHYRLVRRWLESKGLDHEDAYCARAPIGDTWTMSASQLLKAREIGIIDRLPTITEAEIHDKSKSDTLVKLLVMIQVIWLVIQLIIRASTGRQSSQLEVTAVAFAVCAFFTYVLLLQQPKDIRTPTVIRARRSPDYDEFIRIVKWSNVSLMLGFFRDHWMPNYAFSTCSQPYVNGREPDTFEAATVGMAIFSAIHLIAWNFQYPNDTERILWRISALFTTVIPLTLLVLVKCLQGRGEVLHQFVDIFTIVSVLVFPFPRLYLLVEAFRSTYFLTPTTYRDVGEQYPAHWLGSLNWQFVCTLDSVSGYLIESTNLHNIRRPIPRVNLPNQAFIVA